MVDILGGRWDLNAHLVHSGAILTSEAIPVTVKAIKAIKAT